MTGNARTFRVRPPMIGSVGPVERRHRHRIVAAFVLAAQAMLGAAAIVVGHPSSGRQRLVTLLVLLACSAVLVYELRWQRRHDRLTGLLNQTGLEERARRASARCSRRGQQVAVVLVELDGFRRVTESAGHGFADCVITEIGGRLQIVAGNHDLVGRLNGGPFALVLPGVVNIEAALAVAQAALATVARAVDDGAHRVHLSASIGVAMQPEHGRTAAQLLRNAEAALAAVRADGGDGICVYRRELNEQARTRLALEADLHGALERNELVVRYQPVVDLMDGTVTAVEALVRWQHPTFGLLGADEFVPLAEATGLMVRIDDWVLGEVCEQLRLWTADGLPTIRAAVNMTARHFIDPRFVNHVAATIAGAGIDPHRLELEITERVAMADGPAAVASLEGLRRIGVRISLDDFCTGFSSLSLLQRLPVDRIKIDRSFVSAIDHPNGPAPLVEALLVVAGRLHLGVIAEGIETPAQHTFLRRHGCLEGQGFLFGEALAAHELAALVRTRADRASEAVTLR